MNISNLKITNIKNKYLLLSTIISFAISLLLYLYALRVSWNGTILIGLVVFIPSFVVCLINFIGKKTSNKYPILTKIITYKDDYATKKILC